MSLRRRRERLVSTVTVLSRAGCHLCEEAIVALRRIQPELGFELEERDIDCDTALQRAYFDRIPVICVDGAELCEHFLDEALLRERLESRS